MKKILTILIGIFTSIVIIAPPIPFSIPLMVNTFHWCFLIVIAAFLGMLTIQFDFPKHLKVLAVFLLCASFLSQSPYLSFNAYVCLIFCYWLFYAFRYIDWPLFLKFIAAAFWLQCILTGFQLAGKDTMLSFDNNKPVFMGTVMQYMRFGSLLTVMAPFVIMRRGWYVIPVVVMCILSQSSSFALALIAGAVTYCILATRNRIPRFPVLFFGAVLVTAYAIYDWGSFRGAILPENGGRLISWLVIFKTWFMDTSQAIAIDPWSIAGPFNLQWFLIGHGMDTFLPLFPIYKHDMNPFPQAHNSWLQYLWEVGLIGFGIIFSYCVCLVKRLYRIRDKGMLASCAVLAVSMFFTFPDRMTQTIVLLVAFLALCEYKIKKNSAPRTTR